MANALYPSGKKSILDSGVGADLRFALIDTADETYNAADDFVSDILAAGIVARMSATLASITTTDGTLDAADPTINSVTGDTVEAVVLYKYNASDAAAQLIAWIDSSPAIAFTPNGSNVTLTLDALGIFSI